jgi:hypothetical protein
LNDVGLVVIERYQRPSALLLVSKPWEAWHEVKDFLWKCLRLRVSTGGYRPLSRDNHLEAVGQFILSLSDQVLATGLAILVAGVSNECRLSIFEFNIDVSLGWFSITTHLATLSLLHEYFLRNTVVRNWRLLGIAASMGLVVFGLVITSELLDSGQDPRVCMVLAFEYAPGTTSNFGLVSTFVTVIYLTAAFSGTVLSSSQPNQVAGGFLRWCHVTLVVPFMQTRRRTYGSNSKDRVRVA